MHEIEVKILEIDPSVIREQLLALGAERIFDGRVDSVFLRNERGDKLRLRRMGERNFITHKTSLPSLAAKSNDEQETDVGDLTVMEAILVRTGWEVYARNSKHRESYHLGEDVSYELDTVPGIPPYLEVEAQSEDRLREAVEKLGYSMADTLALGEGKVRERYGILGNPGNPVY
jgi:adenylate cyclase, class 2